MTFDPIYAFRLVGIDSATGIELDERIIEDGTMKDARLEADSMLLNYADIGHVDILSDACELLDVVER